MSLKEIDRTGVRDELRSQFGNCLVRFNVKSITVILPTIWKDPVKLSAAANEVVERTMDLVYNDVVAVVDDSCKNMSGDYIQFRFVPKANA